MYIKTAKENKKINITNKRLSEWKRRGICGRATVGAAHCGFCHFALCWLGETNGIIWRPQKMVRPLQRDMALEMFRPDRQQLLKNHQCYLNLRFECAHTFEMLLPNVIFTTVFH